VSEEERRPSDYLPKIEALAEAARANDETVFYATLDDLTAMSESRLFQDIGRLTRQLHEALNNFHVDSRVEQLASAEIPDARNRLDEVIRMTEESAHKTMDLIEETVPLAERLTGESTRLAREWQRFRRRELDAEAFRGLLRETEDYLASADHVSSEIGKRLSSMLMAQDFQDLSGQVIRKVIDLVQEVEATLINMIRISGRPKTASTESEEPDEAEDANKQRVNGQDEVDDILSSLGF
jgi:chemotaxis protein CheZ